METKSTILELVDGQFKTVEWSYFTHLTVREIVRKPFVLKTHDLYFAGDGWGTDIGKIIAKKHPGKVRHLIEWLEIILPYWSSEMLDKQLISLPMRQIGQGNASEVLAKIQELVEHQTEVVA